MHPDHTAVQRPALSLDYAGDDQNPRLSSDRFDLGDRRSGDRDGRVVVGEVIFPARVMSFTNDASESASLGVPADTDVSIEAASDYSNAS